MTEKRFTEIISLMSVKDNQTDREYKCEMGIDTDLLNLLNEQHEEIEELKSENKRLQGKASSWKITASEQIMEQSKLMKENEQLKQRIKVLEDTIDGLTGTIAHFDLDEVILND